MKLQPKHVGISNSDTHPKALTQIALGFLRCTTFNWAFDDEYAAVGYLQNQRLC